MKCPHCGKRYSNNKTVVVEHQGEPMSLRELAFTVGLAYSTLIYRYRRGDRNEKLVRPVDPTQSRKRLVAYSSMASNEFHVELGDGSAR